MAGTGGTCELTLVDLWAEGIQDEGLLEGIGMFGYTQYNIIRVYIYIINYNYIYI